MKALFINRLTGIAVADPLGNGVELLDGVYLTNQNDLIKNMVDSPNLIRSIGKLEHDWLCDKHSLVVYAMPDYELPSALHDVNPLPLLDHFLKLVQLVPMMLWLLRDNSVNFGMGFAELPHKGRRSHVSANSRAVFYLNAAGEQQDITFTKDELYSVRSLYTGVFSKVESMNTLEIGAESDDPQHEAYSASRLERVFYFVQAARNSSDLGVRISLYITCLEALLSTDTNELSHKLAERIAITIATGGSERMAVYRNIKQAYSIRSKVFHGDKLSTGQINSLPVISNDVDGILRQLLIYLLTDDDFRTQLNSNKDELDNYFLRKVLSIDSVEDGNDDIE